MIGSPVPLGQVSIAKEVPLLTIDELLDEVTLVEKRFHWVGQAEKALGVVIALHQLRIQLFQSGIVQSWVPPVDAVGLGTAAPPGPRPL